MNKNIVFAFRVRGLEVCCLRFRGSSTGLRTDHSSKSAPSLDGDGSSSPPASAKHWMCSMDLDYWSQLCEAANRPTCHTALDSDLLNATRLRPQVNFRNPE